jgi:hypothetical protein
METHLSKTVQLAREAGIDAWWDSGSDWRETFDEHLKAFEALVRADELVRPCCGDFDKCQQVCMPRAAAQEREACAKLCDDLPTPERMSLDSESLWEVATLDCAEAIRARGQA